MIALVLVSIATAGLLGWVVVRTSFEIRVPRALSGVRIGSAAWLVSRAPSRSGRVGEEPADGDPAVAQEDVELAVRERLYGARARERR